MPDRHRVLVVDDDGVIRGFLADALDLEGYETRVCADGREALVAAAAWRPDVIVLDLMMPVMDGYAFRRRQLATPALAAVPVILLSAARDLPARTAALAPAAVFAKPFDLDPFLECIARLVGQAP